MQPDPLAQLHDIQLPEQIGWWPLAWGWYVLLLLFMFLCIFITRAVFSRIKRRRPRRLALRMVNDVEAIASPQAKAAALNNILKRAVMAYEARQETAKLSARQWATWLNTHAQEGSAIEAHYLTLAYRPDCDAEQVEAYLLQVRHWLQRNLPLKKTVAANSPVEELQNV